MGHPLQTAPEKNGVGARVAIGLANNAISYLRDMRDYMARDERRAESHSRMFRAQAATHRQVITAANTPVEIAPANSLRRGLLVQNADTTIATLGLGGEPRDRNGIVLAGFNGVLSTPEWDGLVSGVLYTGSVWAISTGITTLTITEIS